MKDDDDELYAKRRATAEQWIRERAIPEATEEETFQTLCWLLIERAMMSPDLRTSMLALIALRLGEISWRLHEWDEDGGLPVCGSISVQVERE